MLKTIAASRALTSAAEFDLWIGQEQLTDPAVGEMRNRCGVAQPSDLQVE
jgi:hypothetical protein